MCQGSSYSLEVISTLFSILRVSSGKSFPFNSILGPHLTMYHIYLQSIAPVFSKSCFERCAPVSRNKLITCVCLYERNRKQRELSWHGCFCLLFFFFLSLKSNITHVHKQPVKVLTWYLPPPQKQWVFSKVIDVVSRFAVTCKNHSHTEFTKVLSSALKWKGMYPLLFKIIIIIIFNLAPA